jgi:hypothetical protein
LLAASQLGSHADSRERASLRQNGFTPDNARRETRQTGTDPTRQLRYHCSIIKESSAIVQAKREQQKRSFYIEFSHPNSFSTASKYSSLQPATTQIMAADKNLDHVFKILLVGDAGVGKSRFAVFRMQNHSPSPISSQHSHTADSIITIPTFSTTPSPSPYPYHSQHQPPHLLSASTSPPSLIPFQHSHAVHAR